MRITNLASLPEPLVRAVSYSDRDVGDSDYTITELISPPRIVALRRQHADELTEDAADRIWALMGSAAHEVLRRASNAEVVHLCPLGDGAHLRCCNTLVLEAPRTDRITLDESLVTCDGKNPWTRKVVEQRFFADVSGKRISGQVDYSSSSGEIFDYKITSMWSIKDGVKPEWEQQLNCYRYLLSRNGRTGHTLPDRLEIIAILRDWSKPEARRNPEMPQQGVIVLPVEVWPLDVAEVFISDRIEAHEQAKTNLPECMPEEMWERPAVWAVKKRGGTRAIPGGICHTEAEALVLAGRDAKLEVEYRPGTRPRCAAYCNVSEWCVQNKQWLASNGGAV